MNSFERGSALVVGFGVLLASMLFQSCFYRKDLVVVALTLNDQKEALRQVHASAPMSRSNYLTIREYFVGLTELTSSIDDEDERARFSEAVGRMSLSEFCKKALLPRDEWRSLVQRCTKNGLFLCSQKVREYPAEVEIIRSVMTSDDQNRFDSEPNCVVAMNGDASRLQQSL